jgi:hypothetical protein
MAKHRPAHARTGLGRYTAPRRLHPAHAAPSADGIRLARVAATVVGGGVLAGAGLMGLVSVPSGAAVLGPTSSPPFNVLATTTTDADGSIAGISVLGGTALDPSTAEAEAGVGTAANLDDNLALSVADGVGDFASSQAGTGADANLSDNTSLSTATGLNGVAESVAGNGLDANVSGNLATAWTFSGTSEADAGVAVDAQSADNIAYAASQLGGVADADAGAGVTHGNGDGNRAYAYSVGGLFPGAVAIAIAGFGSGNVSDNLAVADAPQGIGEATIEESNASSATVGAAGGVAIGVIIDATGSHEAAVAAGAGAISTTEIAGSGDSASASSIGTGATATSEVVGTGETANTSAVGTGSSATALEEPGVASVASSAGLGGVSAASNSSGESSVSINGATTIIG